MSIGSISCETVVVGYNAYQSPSVCNGSEADLRYGPKRGRWSPTQNDPE